MRDESSQDRPAPTGPQTLRAVFDAMGELVMVRDASGRLTEVNAAFLKAFGGAREDWTGRWLAKAPSFGEDGEGERYDAAMSTRLGEMWIEWTETPLPGGGSVSVGRDVSEERRSRAALSEAASGKSVFFAAVTHELRTPLSGTLGAARLLRETSLAPDQASYVDAIQSSASHALALIDDILDLSRLEAGKLELRTEPADLRALVEDSAELLATRAAEKGLTLAYAVDPDVPARLSADPARLRQVLFNLAGNAVKFTGAGGVLIHAERAGEFVRLSVKDTGPGIAKADRSSLFQQFERGAADKSAAPGAGLGLAMVKRLAEAMGGEVGVNSKPGEGALFWFAFPIRDPEEGELSLKLAGTRLIVASPCPTQRRGLALQATGLGARVSAADTPGRLQGLIEAAGGDAVLVIDEAWADRAAGLHNRNGALRVLALAQPRTKDLFAPALRPKGIDGWLVAPVRPRSLAEYASLKTRLEAPAERPVEPVPPPRAGPADGSLQGLQVLLAEDDPVNGLIAERVLTRLGARVVRAEDGAAALDQVRSGRFDAVLLDLRMPRLDGMAAARAIRALPNGRGLPLIALTANTTETDRTACLAAGMNEFLSKPLDPARLHSVLSALCAPQNRARVG